MNKDIWTDRQVMLGKSAFEFYHYLDEVPPKVEFHQHPFYELFFFLDGNANYTIEGKTYKLRPGDILLTNSLDIHRPEIFPGKPYERVVVWLEDRFFEQLRSGGDDLASCFADAAMPLYWLEKQSQLFAGTPEHVEEIFYAAISAVSMNQYDRLSRALADEKLSGILREIYSQADSQKAVRLYPGALRRIADERLEPPEKRTCAGF